MDSLNYPDCSKFVKFVKVESDIANDPITCGLSSSSSQRGLSCSTSCHISKDCRTRMKCKICDIYHPTLLHDPANTKKKNSLRQSTLCQMRYRQHVQMLT